MNRIIIIAFICWGIGCFAGGYLVGGWTGWEKGYYYGIKTSYYKINGVQIAGTGDEGFRKGWEGN